MIGRICTLPTKQLSIHRSGLIAALKLHPNPLNLTLKPNQNPKPQP